MYRIKYSVLFFITLVSINLWSVTSLQLITTPQAKVFINDEEIEDVNSDGKYLKSGFPTNKTIEIKFTIDGYKDLLKHIRFSNSFENKKIVVSESDFEKLHNISNLTKVGIVQVLSIPNNLEFTINGKIQYTNTKFSQLKVGEYIFEFDYDGTKLKSTAKFATNGNYVIQADFTNKKLLVAKEIIFRTNDSWETLKINGNNVSENSNYFKDYYEISEIHEIKATSNGQTITKIIDFQQNYEDIFFSNLIFVKGGTFMMGSSKEKAPSDEKPLHKVKVNDFVMSKFEVTQKEWFSIMKTNPSITKNDMFPVTAVSWVKAVEFCNEKSIAENFDPCYNIDGLKVSCDFTKNGYRLPTEAEWEYAAKGGTKSKNYIYAGSNNVNEVAHYAMNSKKETHIVGEKKPNELGIFDLSGNVQEWCWDWHSSDYYQFSPTNSPTGPENGRSKILRGGNYRDVKSRVTTTVRWVGTKSTRRPHIGFRIVRTK